MATRSPVLSTAEVRRPVVAASAVREFARGGYHGTTVADVARESRISPAYGPAGGLVNTSQQIGGAFGLVAAWAVPVLVLGQFAPLAIVPVAVVLADSRVRALRRYTGLLAALHATPIVIWLTRPDGAESLSKDIHPAFVVLIVAAAAALLREIYPRRRH